jgi:hypothetical protein
MKPVECIECKNFPCSGIDKSGYIMPAADLDPEKVKVVMIFEAPPENPHDYFYAPGDPFIEVHMLMGDVAIKAFNYISKRLTGKILCLGFDIQNKERKVFYKGKGFFLPMFRQGRIT